MAQRVVHVGIGVFGKRWCSEFLKSNVNHWLIEQFAQWRDGGPPMETRVEENLQACALVFAAIESQKTGLPVDVQEFIGSRASAAAA